MTVKIVGELEVDIERGVLYFHNYRNGMTTLRICGLKDKLADFSVKAQLDITLPVVLRSTLSFGESAQPKPFAEEDKARKEHFDAAIEDAKNFFLNEQHTTHITKAQARKERRAHRIKLAGELGAMTIRDALTATSVSRQLLPAVPVKNRKKKGKKRRSK